MAKTLPDKELIRKWLKTEISRHRPPPSPTEIRRELGWSFIDMEWNTKRKRAPRRG